MSWIGALLNTWQLDSKTWFAVLLLLGIFNLGFFAMIAYLIAGPDGTALHRAERDARPRRGLTRPQRPRRWGRSARPGVGSDPEGAPDD